MHDFFVALVCHFLLSLFYIMIDRRVNEEKNQKLSITGPTTVKYWLSGWETYVFICIYLNTYIYIKYYDIPNNYLVTIFHWLRCVRCAITWARDKRMCTYHMYALFFRRAKTCFDRLIYDVFLSIDRPVMACHGDFYILIFVGFFFSHRNGYIDFISSKIECDIM